MRIVKSGVHRALRSLGFDVVRSPGRHPGAIHFLHLGKCAGTQIKTLAKQINRHEGGTRIVTHSHFVTLADLPSGTPYFFSIRDPLTRFVSGFYSRKRMGRPRIHVPWSEHDAFAFEHFHHANELAEALFNDSDDGHRATAAMKSLVHASMNQVDWFSTTGAFPYVRPPVWIVRQDRFDDDFRRFLRRAGLGHLHEHLVVEHDPVRRHANDYSDAPPLSAKAREKLRIWYAQDLAFYRMCLAWLRRQDDEERDCDA